MNFYLLLGYAAKEENDGGFTVSCYTSVIESTNEFSARDRMLSFTLEKLPLERGWVDHSISLANTTGYKIERDPSIGQFDPGLHVFFMYAAREYYRSPLSRWRPPYVLVLSRVVDCRDPLVDGQAIALQQALETLHTDSSWRGHLAVPVNTANFRITKEEE